ncbi:MAG: TRAP transporter small permease [bacterium]
MKKAIDMLQKIQIAIGGFFLLIFLVTVVIQMACRYMGIAAMWTEDVSMYSFIWAVFTGAGAMVHSKAHFAFTTLSDSMKDPRKKAMLQIFINIVMLIFAALMVKYGIDAAKQFWNFRWISIPALKRGPTWLCIPLCGATSCIYLLYSLYEEIRKLTKGGQV